MVYVMRRYQVYLNPRTVGNLDALAAELDLSRSQVIRDALDAVAAQYRKIVALLYSPTGEGHPILNLKGIAKTKTGKTAKGHDEIYLRD